MTDILQGQHSNLHFIPSFISGDAYVELPSDPIPWVVQNLIPIGGLVNLYGKPKTHKSYLGLQIASSVSNPLIGDVIGFPVLKHGNVAYLQIDTPRSMWKDRVAKLKAGGFSFKDVYFADALLVPTYPFNILIPSHKEWMMEKMAALQPVLIVIDTLRELHNGDEDSSTVMKNVIASVQEAACGAAVMFISHARKSKFGESDDVTDDSRGSGYVSGRMDTIGKLTEKTLMLKGRNVIAETIPISKDPQLHIITLAESKLESDLGKHLIEGIFKETPSITLGDAARKLVNYYPNMKLATAIKRIQRWKEGKL